MKEGYRLLGDFIRQVDVRNTDGKEENLLGVSVQKMFIPSIANTVGTDFTKYKVVKRGQFTYIPDTSRRGDKIGIALLMDYDEGLVSNIYTVFEVKDENELLPEYLMLWFSRPEFDRYARFKSHGSVREIMDWDEMCKVKLPVPSIEKQRSIVKAYNTITDRIELKRKINDNLEQQAKLLYDFWFTQFDFPDEKGKPYRASGGQMQWNDTLKRYVPIGWRVVPLLKVANWESNSQPPKSEFIYKPREGYVRFIQNRDYGSSAHKTYIPLTKSLSIVDRYDILMDKYGDAGAVRYGIEGAFNVALGKINVHDKNHREYVRSFLASDGIYNYLHNSCMASTRASLNESNLAMLNIVIPDDSIVAKYEELLREIRDSILKTNDETAKLIELRDWLLPILMNGQASVED